MRNTIFALALYLVTGCVTSDGYTGDVHQAALTLGPVSPASGVPGTNTTTWTISGSQVSFRGEWVINLSLPVGQPIPPITVTARDNAATCSTCFDGDNVRLRIMSTIGSTTTALVDMLTCGCGTAGAVALTSPASHLVSDGEVLQLVADTFTLFSGTRQDAITQVMVAAPPSGLRTITIAPNPTGIPAYSVIDVTAGTGNSTSNLDGYFSVGDHLRAIRIIVQDNTLPGPAVGYSGPTKLIARLKAYSPAGGSVPETLATSTESTGSGLAQTMTMSGFDVPIVTGGITHSVQTIDNIGVAPTIVWSIEVDYDHPSG